MATSTIKPKRGTTAQWVKSKRILEWNEWGVEETVSGAWILRVGDGEHEFIDLPKVIDTPTLNELVAEARSTYKLFFEGAEAKEIRFEELSAEIDRKHSEAISAIETKGAETLATIPEDYTETYNRAVKNSRDIEFATSTATRNDKRLTNIEKALSEDKFSIDSSVAYTKDVPEDALPYAEVTEIGGITRKSTNLLDLSIVREVSGTLTLSGDTLSVTGYIATAKIENLTVGKKYTFRADSTRTGSGGGGFSVVFRNGTTVIGEIYGANDLNPNVTFTVPEETTLSVLYFYGSETLSAKDTATYTSVMLNEGDTALPYEPYFEGLRSALVTEVESVGANLIPYPYVETTKTRNGITFTDNGDGSITVNGTATNQTEFHLTNQTSKYVGKMICASGGISKDCSMMIINYNGKNSQDSGAGATMIPEGGIAVWILVQAGATINNVTIYPMLNKGTNALPYTPYVRNTLPIPEAVQALDGYGWGVNEDCYNYIDWDKKQFVKRVKKVVLDGTEAWFFKYNRFEAYTLSEKSAEYTKPCVCSKYAHNESVYSNSATEEGILSHEGMIYIRDFDYTDVETFKNSLAEQYANGNPVTAYYELTEPVITDISDILPDDNLIGVEGGGTVTMVNEYEYAVPSEVVYRLKEGESA